MRLLAASLILVTFVTLIGFGWALDVLFVRATPAGQVTEVTDWSGVAGKLAITLDKIDFSEEFVSRWPADTPLQLIPMAEFPLPAQVRNSFFAGDPLILESDSGISVHYYLPKKQEVLVLGPTPVYAEDSHLPILFTSIFYAGVLLLLLFWIYPLIKRLLALERSARQFGLGDLSERVSQKGVSYIGQIEREFNHMANRIQTLVADNKLLSSAVSHELRTPIARLRFGIDALSDTEDSATRDKYIDRISSDIELMEKLVNSLLNYARLDNQLHDARRSHIDLGALLDECLVQFRDEKVAIQFTSDCGDKSSVGKDNTRESCIVTGNADYLAMLFNNVITNAIKYADNQVEVSLYRSVDSIHLRIADDGPGIAPEMRTEILKPFQRIAEGSQSGYGLGLAIVARIARSHDVTLDVNNDDALGGAVFKLTFPKAV